ncbi:uncharacterized protein LOC132706397 [Cylas formicarius]|uniref:uncharacterized protein LOC132706397 n=1 Tax=Cylas formicarius TaxID=197179 RepID=UPI00295891B2|nr:uncharacterized protein LOC132706397 [Cylas formicarius]
MVSRLLLFSSVILTFLVFAVDETVEGRYLPTRSNGDKIDKIRELLKDILESEMEKDEPDPPRWRPESKFLYKRDVKIDDAPARNVLLTKTI